MTREGFSENETFEFGLKGQGTCEAQEMARSGMRIEFGRLEPKKGPV